MLGSQRGLLDVLVRSGCYSELGLSEKYWSVSGEIVGMIEVYSRVSGDRSVGE